jgi:hypothetical protein
MARRSSTSHPAWVCWASPAYCVGYSVNTLEPLRYITPCGSALSGSNLRVSS